MKRYVLLILLISSVLITACSARELNFDRAYPNMKGLEEYREKRQAEIDALWNAKSFPHLIGSGTLPHPLQLKPTGAYPFLLKVPLQFCWENTLEECTDFQPINVNDEKIIPLYEYNSRVTEVEVNQNAEVTINLIRETPEIPLPDSLEIYLLEKDGTLQQYPFTMVSNIQYSFSLPSEMNKKIIIIKTIYKEKIGGVSFYALKIRTKP